MMLSIVPFVAAIVIPALAFYLYAMGQFLREAMRLRRVRLTSAQIAVLLPGAAKAAPEQDRRSAVVPFLPNPSRSGQRGAA